MEEEIKAAFEMSGFSLDLEDEVLKNCFTFCINYNVRSSDLVSSWEVNYLKWLHRKGFGGTFEQISTFEHSDKVVGVEGHNPSGYCLVASSVVDTIPLLYPSDMGFPPPNKQTLDQEIQPNSPSPVLGELSLVCKVSCCTVDNPQTA
ncbi:hypothetical protein NE237_007796 [Protea cynaroides]|uniref:DNA polymerase alpha subunit B N-terminal domain-containing protein n=1 Tax=Protea cynaroides TaxID=273540 RepID=A0A9Q0QWR2_9MAGN|nr:hypothetical protein NE237_007796 [Protea cynaroides]